MADTVSDATIEDVLAMLGECEPILRARPPMLSHAEKADHAHHNEDHHSACPAFTNEAACENDAFCDWNPDTASCHSMDDGDFDFHFKNKKPEEVVEAPEIRDCMERLAAMTQGKTCEFWDSAEDLETKVKLRDLNDDCFINDAQDCVEENDENGYEQATSSSSDYVDPVPEVGFMKLPFKCKWDDFEYNIYPLDEAGIANDGKKCLDIWLDPVFGTVSLEGCLSSEIEIGCGKKKTSCPNYDIDIGGKIKVYFPGGSQTIFSTPSITSTSKKMKLKKIKLGQKLQITFHRYENCCLGSWMAEVTVTPKVGALSTKIWLMWDLPVDMWDCDDLKKMMD